MLRSIAKSILFVAAVTLTLSHNTQAAQPPADAPLVDKLDWHFGKMESTNNDIEILRLIHTQLEVLTKSDSPTYVGQEQQSAYFRYGTFRKTVQLVDSNLKVWKKSTENIQDARTKIAVDLILSKLATPVANKVDNWSKFHDQYIQAIIGVRSELGNLMAVMSDDRKEQLDSLSIFLSTINPSQITSDVEARLETIRGEIDLANKELIGIKEALVTARAEHDLAISGLSVERSQVEAELGATRERISTEQAAASSAFLSERAALQREREVVDTARREIDAELAAKKGKMAAIEAQIEKLTEGGRSGVIQVNIASPNPTDWSASYRDLFAQSLSPIIQKQIEDVLAEIKDAMPTSYQPNVTLSMVFNNVEKMRRLGFGPVRGFKAVAKVTVELSYQFQKRTIRKEISLKSDGDVPRRIVSEIREFLNSEAEQNLKDMAEGHVDCKALAQIPAPSQGRQL